jgi:hypothetical protein
MAIKIMKLKQSFVMKREDKGSFCEKKARY